MFRTVCSPFKNSFRLAQSLRRRVGISPFALGRRFGEKPPRIDPDVQERIMELSRRFLERVKDAQPDKLTAGATFEELGMDSLDAVDFVVVLEESFGFDISNEDAENRIRGIRDACEVFTEYVERRARETPGEPKQPGGESN